MISFILLIVIQFPFYFLVPKSFTPDTNTKLTNSIIKAFMAFAMLMFVGFVANILPFMFSLYFIVWVILFSILYILVWSLFIYKTYKKVIVFSWEINKTDLLVLLIFVITFLVIAFQSITTFDQDNYFYVNLVKSNNWFSPTNLHGSYSNNISHKSYYILESYYLFISFFSHINNSAVISLIYTNKLISLFFEILIFILLFNKNKKILFLFSLLAVIFIFQFYHILLLCERGVEVSFLFGAFWVYFLINIYDKNNKTMNFYLMAITLGVCSVSAYFIVVAILLMIMYILWSRKVSNLELVVFFAMVLLAKLSGFQDTQIWLSLLVYISMPIIYFVITKFNIAFYINKIFDKFNFSSIFIVSITSIGLLVMYIVLDCLNMMNLANTYNAFVINIFMTFTYVQVLLDFSVWLFVLAWAIGLYKLIKYKKNSFSEFVFFIVVNPLFWPIFLYLLHRTTYRFYLILIPELFLICCLFFKQLWLKYYNIVFKFIDNKTPQYFLAIIMAPWIISSAIMAGTYSHNFNSGLSINSNDIFLRATDFKDFNKHLTNKDTTIISVKSNRSQLFLESSVFLMVVWNSSHINEFRKRNPYILKNFTDQQLIDGIKKLTRDIEVKGIMDDQDYQFVKKTKSTKIVVNTNIKIIINNSSHVTLLSHNNKNYDLLAID